MVAFSLVNVAAMTRTVEGCRGFFDAFGKYNLLEDMERSFDSLNEYFRAEGRLRHSEFVSIFVLLKGLNVRRKVETQDTFCRFLGKDPVEMEHPASAFTMTGYQELAKYPELSSSTYVSNALRIIHAAHQGHWFYFFYLCRTLRLSTLQKCAILCIFSYIRFRALMDLATVPAEASRLGYNRYRSALSLRKLSEWLLFDDVAHCREFIELIGLGGLLFASDEDDGELMFRTVDSDRKQVVSLTAVSESLQQNRRLICFPPHRDFIGLEPFHEAIDDDDGKLFSADVTQPNCPINFMTILEPYAPPYRKKLREVILEDCPESEFATIEADRVFFLGAERDDREMDDMREAGSDGDASSDARSEPPSLPETRSDCFADEYLSDADPVVVSEDEGPSHLDSREPPHGSTPLLKFLPKGDDGAPSSTQSLLAETHQMLFSLTCRPLYERLCQNAAAAREAQRRELVERESLARSAIGTEETEERSRVMQQHNARLRMEQLSRPFVGIVPKAVSQWKPVTALSALANGSSVPQPFSTVEGPAAVKMPTLPQAKRIPGPTPATQTAQTEATSPSKRPPQHSVPAPTPALAPKPAPSSKPLAAKPSASEITCPTQELEQQRVTREADEADERRRRGEWVRRVFLHCGTIKRIPREEVPAVAWASIMERLMLSAYSRAIRSPYLSSIFNGLIHDSAEARSQGAWALRGMNLYAGGGAHDGSFGFRMGSVVLLVGEDTSPGDREPVSLVRKAAAALKASDTALDDLHSGSLLLRECATHSVPVAGSLTLRRPRLSSRLSDSGVEVVETNVLGYLIDSADVERVHFKLPAKKLPMPEEPGTCESSALTLAEHQAAVTAIVCLDFSRRSLAENSFFVVQEIARKAAAQDGLVLAGAVFILATADDEPQTEDPGEDYSDTVETMFWGHWESERRLLQIQPSGKEQAGFSDENQPPPQTHALAAPGSSSQKGKKRSAFSFVSDSGAGSMPFQNDVVVGSDGRLAFVQKSRCGGDTERTHLPPPPVLAFMPLREVNLQALQQKRPWTVAFSQALYTAISSLVTAYEEANRQFVRLKTVESGAGHKRQRD
jgi:hypothetical protein